MKLRNYYVSTAVSFRLVVLIRATRSGKFVSWSNFVSFKTSKLREAGNEIYAFSRTKLVRADSWNLTLYL